MSTLKLSMIKIGDYDIWRMRMDQYLTHTDHALCEVIANGDTSASIASVSIGVEASLLPKTIKQKIARRNELQGKSTMFLAKPDEHLLKFHGIKDAKTLWEAIKTRFCGNKESKKIHKTILKQQYENVTASRYEGLDKTYDRYKASKGYHTVPPPFTRKFMPPKPDLSFTGLDNSGFKSPAKIDEFNLWHRRLGQINFKTMNKLVKRNLVRGLPTKIFEKEHACVACQKGKQHKASYHVGKYEGKANEGLLVGCSVNSKAFRIFNSRTRKVEENLHINFLENKSNVARSGLAWLFNIDSLVKCMNYDPVIIGNQTNNDAGIEINFNAEQDRQKKASDHEYILLPLMSSNSPFSLSTQSSDDKDANEVQGKEDERVCKGSGIDDSKRDDSSTQDVNTVEPKTDIFNDREIGAEADTNNIEISTVVYVDDIIFGSTKKSLCDEFEQIMHKRFEMSSIGELTFFLGLQTASTLIETNKALVKDEKAEDVDVYLYKSMIRSLMYLTAFRPDIMFAVCACARLQVTPKVSHLYAVKRNLGKRIMQTKVPQLSVPSVTKVDEAVHKEKGDSLLMAATTAASLDVEQDSGKEIVVDRDVEFVQKVVDKVVEDVTVAKIEEYVTTATSVLSVDERSKMLAELIDSRRKFFATKRAKEIRNKPPTKAQQKTLMCTYLKNMEGHMQKHFKGKSYDAIKKMFDQAYKRVNTFVPIEFEVVEKPKSVEGEMIEGS
nr:hypothetical protein [Tanacetum cinerariifolium]